VPTYAYKCRECGNAFDIQQAFSDDALTVCPSCGGALRKVFGTVGVTVNGPGFARADPRAATKSSDPASQRAEPSKPNHAPAAAGASSSTSSSDSSASKAPSTPKKAQTP
jgi:putative FmdB family regulatory protein